MKPGDFIRYENSYRVKPLVSPGVYYEVTQGMTMKIVPTEHIEWPPPYRDATEKYSQQVRLSPDGRTMVNYVAWTAISISGSERSQDCDQDHVE